MHKDKPKVAGRAKWKRLGDEGGHIHRAEVLGDDGEVFATVDRFFSPRNGYLGTEFIMHGQGGWTGTAEAASQVDDRRQAQADWQQAKEKIATAWHQELRSKEIMQQRHDVENGLSHYLSEDTVDRLMYSALGARFKGMHMGVLEEILDALKKAKRPRDVAAATPSISRAKQRTK